MPRPNSESATQTCPDPGRILLVDDQPELRRLFRRSLGRAGYEVLEASNAAAAIELAREHHFDVVISDMGMPDLSGLELLHALQTLDPDLPVVLVSGSLDGAGEMSAVHCGAFAYLMKPVSFDAIHDNVSQAIELRRARAEMRAHFEPYASVERLRVPSEPEGSE